MLDSDASGIPNDITGMERTQSTISHVMSTWGQDVVAAVGGTRLMSDVMPDRAGVGAGSGCGHEATEKGLFKNGGWGVMKKGGTPLYMSLLYREVLLR